MGKIMRWWKFRPDEVFDKVNDFDATTLTPAERWVWVAIRTVCSVCRFQPMICINPQVGFTDEQLAATMKIDLDLWKQTKKKLIDFGRIVVDDYNVITIVDWDKFQSSYYTLKRQRKHFDVVPILTSTQLVAKQLKPKEQEDRQKIVDMIKEVLEYLNVAAGTHYRYRSSAHAKFISGRIGEGATMDDFKFVIDQKAREWVNTSMSIYLRPSTLFNATKFWEYRNEKPIAPNSHSRGMPKQWTAPKEYKVEYEKLIDELKKKYGWKTDDEVDPFLAPTFSEFCRNKIRLEREKKNETNCI